MVTLILLSSLGQFRRQCVVQPQYYQPQYYYQQQYYQPEQYAQFVAINDYDLVGQQERLNLSNEREAKLDKVINYIESLKNKPVENQNYIESKSIEDQEDPPIKWNNSYQEVKPVEPRPVESRPVPLSEAAPPPPPVPIPTPPVPITLINDAPQNVIIIFKNSCISCHSNKSNKNMNLFTVEGKPNSLTPKQLLKIDFLVQNGSMPKKGGPLSNESYTIIREWIGTYQDQILTSMK